MGDVKFMENYKSGSTVFLKQWNEDHGFTGKLTKTSCERLMGRLKATAAGKKGKAREKIRRTDKSSNIVDRVAQRRAEIRKKRLNRHRPPLRMVNAP